MSLRDFVPDFNLESSSNNDETTLTPAETVKTPKKRGRKPKNSVNTEVVDTLSNDETTITLSDSRKYTDKDVDYVYENFSKQSKEDIAKHLNLAAAQVSRIVGKLKKGLQNSATLGQITQDECDKIITEKLTPPKKERKKKNAEFVIDSAISKIIDTIKNV